MPNTTYPNQRMVRVHREPIKSDFLGIKNENWQAASRDLGAHALQLYLYLASNANNYTLALSPAAVRQAIGMARSTYHDQFNKLIDRGYLVLSHGNTYEFYEAPNSDTQSKNAASAEGLDFESDPITDTPLSFGGQEEPPEGIEINNKANAPHTKPIDISSGEQEVGQKPAIKEVRIPVPIAAGRKRPVYSPKPEKAGFVF